MFATSTRVITTRTRTAVQSFFTTTTLPRRSYVSRAHPRPLPEYPVATAMQMVLDGTNERKVLRVARWERNAPVRVQKGITETGPYRNMDETVELAINLNVDPRRPGQALRGSLRLPHGTGKTVQCLVFTSDETIAEQATSQGHTAGGAALVEQIVNGDVSVDALDRALATKDLLPSVQKKLARILGPKGLMPNPKTNTVFESSTALWETLQESSQTITYRTESNGIVHVAIGKASFSAQALMENLQAVCQTVQDIKPETYGKGKKKSKKMGKNVKYWIRASLASTQGKGVRMDLRTVDPTSPFFMKEPE